MRSTSLPSVAGRRAKSRAAPVSLKRWVILMQLLKYAFLGAIITPLIAHASAPKIHTITRGGTTFRHFELVLSSENTLLPNAPQIRRERLDENSKNFEYGQFEVFIPAKNLDIELGCKSNYIVRMPMTIEKEKDSDIKAKQALFFAIKKAVETRTGSVRVVLEITYEKGCNLFFRDGPNGRYIDYVGPIKQKR